MKRANSDLQIRTFSDREILAIMADVTNGADEVIASELALRIFGLKPDEDVDVRLHATRCVTARLTWMRRYGLVVKGDEKGEWAMSEAGRALRFTPLGRSLSSAITNTPEASVMELTHQVSERMLREKDIPARAMRREFQHQVMRRRWS
jgi:hypothetical protein